MRNLTGGGDEAVNRPPPLSETPLYGTAHRLLSTLRTQYFDRAREALRPTGPQRLFISSKLLTNDN
jgi:hypothetical protein